MIQRIVFGALAAVCFIGIIGIPMGDPKFIVNAIILESCFIALAGISLWRFRLVLIPSFVLALIVIIGNSVSSKHITIMTTFSPVENAIVLIIGGYVLQGLLLVACSIGLAKRKNFGFVKPKFK